MFIKYTLFHGKTINIKSDGSMWVDCTKEDKKLLELSVFCKAEYYGKWRSFWKDRTNPDIKEIAIRILSTPELIAFRLTGGNYWNYPGLED